MVISNMELRAYEDLEMKRDILKEKFEKESVDGEDIYAKFKEWHEDNKLIFFKKKEIKMLLDDIAFEYWRIWFTGVFGKRFEAKKEYHYSKSKNFTLKRPARIQAVIDLTNEENEDHGKSNGKKRKTYQSEDESKAMKIDKFKYNAGETLRQKDGMKRLFGEDDKENDKCSTEMQNQSAIVMDKSFLKAKDRYLQGNSTSSFPAYELINPLQKRNRLISKSPTFHQQYKEKYMAIPSSSKNILNNFNDELHNSSIKCRCQPGCSRNGYIKPAEKISFSLPETYDEDDTESIWTSRADSFPPY